MKSLRFLFVLNLCLCLFSCGKEKVGLGNAVDIALDETVNFKEGGFEISLIDISELSCPPQIECDLADQVIFELKIIDGEMEENFNFKYTPADPSFIPFHEYSGYTIEFLRVSPDYEPWSIPIEEYTLSFVILE